MTFLNSTSHLSALAVMTIAVPLVAAEPEFDRKLAAAVSKFLSRREVDRDAAVKRIEQALKAVKRSRLNSSEQVELQNKLIQAKADFGSWERFPRDGSLRDLQFDYFVSLGESFEPIHDLFEKEIDKAVRSDDLSRSNQLINDREKLEKELLKIEPLTTGTALTGTLYRQNGAAIPYKLYVNEGSSTGAFSGTVDDNPGVAGHYRYKVSGQRAGLKLAYQMTQNLRGKFIEVQGEGLIVSDTIIVRLLQQTTDKKEHKAVVVLHR